MEDSIFDEEERQKEPDAMAQESGLIKNPDNDFLAGYMKRIHDSLRIQYMMNDDLSALLRESRGERRVAEEERSINPSGISILTRQLLAECRRSLLEFDSSELPDEVREKVRGEIDELELLLRLKEAA